MLLLNRMLCFGGLSIVLSVVNLVLLSHERTVKPQDPNIFSDGNAKSTENANRVRQNHMKVLNDLGEIHLILSIVFNIIMWSLKLLYNLERFCIRVMFMSLMFVACITGTTGAMLEYNAFYGITSPLVHAYHVVFNMINFYFLTYGFV